MTRHAGTRAGWLWVALAATVALSYLWGLGGLNIPSFGDEMVYLQIARSTAESGHWLPLQSEYGHLRNTKPPLLFWQAMAAGQWGANWHLDALRLPSVIYTWGAAFMAALLAARATGAAGATAASGIGSAHAPTAGDPSHASRLAAAGIAASAFLLFFTTFRFGRTYLTSAPETFWMFAVVTLVAWSPARMLGSRVAVPLACGLLIGMACLYKSFVLAVPMGLVLLALHLRLASTRAPLWRATPRVGVSVLVGLAVFGLWFVLDPDPAAVWREFVVGENAARLSGDRGYLATALGGSSGVGVILVACFSNAGLLLPLVAGLAHAAWRDRRAGVPATSVERTLWLWIAVLTLFFILPSQRTSRYLIPAMPAVAVLLALYWQRIHRLWFAATGLLCVVTVAVLCVAAWGSARAMAPLQPYGATFVTLALLGVVAGVAAMASGAVAGSARARSIAGPIMRPASLVAALAALLCLTAVYEPFNGPAGRFDPQDVRRLAGQRVAVAFQHTGQYEKYRFALTGATVVPLLLTPASADQEADALLALAPRAIVQRWPGQPLCTGCRVLASRWVPGARPGAPLSLGLRHPENYWVSREYVVDRPAP